jgi:hypothetical protein
MTDKERDRILREARATLARPVEPYTPPARMLGDHDPLELEPLDELEPKYTPEPERRQAQPPPAPPAADPWADWERWLETRLNAALAIQRQELVEIVAQVVADAREVIAHVVADERERAAEAMREQVRGLRDDLSRAEQVLEQLRKLVEIERSRTIDLPALPARDRFN